MESEMSSKQAAAHISKLSQRFEQFSRQAEESQMYCVLSAAIAQDHELLLRIPDVQLQPVPNLFLAAVNYQLKKRPNQDLVRFYPNLGGLENPRKIYAPFRAYCFSNMPEIADLMRQRIVQTNEVRRCTLLLPAAALIAQRASRASLHLIDVGAASGLNLLMDQYRVLYSTGQILGMEESSVELTCAVDGRMPVGLATPQIFSRTAIDLNPIDLTKEEELLWAEALIWPDQTDRLERLRKAVAILKKNEVLAKAGRGIDQVESAIRGIEESGAICVMHSFTLNQFSQEDRINFSKTLERLSLYRALWRISLEWIGTEKPELILEYYYEGERKSVEKLAECHQHGAWIKWI